MLVKQTTELTSLRTKYTFVHLLQHYIGETNKIDKLISLRNALPGISE